ncbi:hypothetical protein LguiB_000143 [Lonicera macranthoides]
MQQILSAMVTGHSTTIPSSFIPPNLQKQSTPVQAYLSVYSAANSDQEMNCHGNSSISPSHSLVAGSTVPSHKSSFSSQENSGFSFKFQPKPQSLSIDFPRIIESVESGFLLQNRPENHPTAFSHQNTLLPNSFPTPFQSSTIVQTIAAIPVSTNLPFTATTVANVKNHKQAQHVPTNSAATNVSITTEKTKALLDAILKQLAPHIEKHNLSMPQNASLIIKEVF